MNDLSHHRLTFNALFSQAVAEWPDELRLPRRDLSDGRYLIEGLVDLEEAISRRAKGRADEFLFANMHWAIVTAVHGALGRAPSVRPRDLAPQARTKFHADLKTASAGWSAADLALRDRYVLANPEAA